MLMKGSQYMENSKGHVNSYMKPYILVCSSATKMNGYLYGAYGEMHTTRDAVSKSNLI